MTPEEIEAARKEEKEATIRAVEEKRKAVIETTSPLVTHGDMRSMLQDLFAAGMIGPRAGAGSSDLKLELMPNDVKLEGNKNYLSWSKRAQLILKTKEVEHYLRETCVEPADKVSMDWEMWNTTNSAVVAWLLTSMSPSIARMVEMMQSAPAMWKTLSNMYSGAGNVMMVVEV